jgi:hypothetical protein
MRDDDAFWAARRVMAFSDAMIRAAVDAGGFSRPADADALAAVLRQRRDAIGRTYLPRLNPVVDPALADEGLVVHNAAVEHGVATAPSRYHARWFAFDNGRGTSTPLGETSSDTDRLPLPADLDRSPGSYVRVDVRADHDQHRSWARPVELYFRRDAGAWTLVGLTRLP